MRTFKYRLFPNKKQQSLLWRHANKLNNLYNYFLNQRIENYKLGIKTFKKEQQAELVTLKQEDPELCEIHSQVLQQVTRRLDRSYKDFFRRCKIKGEDPGYPNFRSCKKFFGICYPQAGFSIKKNILSTKAYEDIKFSKHYPLKGNIRQIYITSDIKNKWFICIITDYESPKNSAKKQIGIDVGLKHLVVSTDGEKIKNTTHAKYFDKQISKLQSRRDNKKKGSRRRKSLNKTIRRLYGAKNRKITDFQHKVSKRLACKYDTIFAEKLASKKMSESKYTSLNKALRNAKIAQFISFMKYKTNNLVLVNPAYTSKMCNNCGQIRENLKLSDREITCFKCGKVYDRDENAAKNVYCLGQAILSGECTQSSTIVEALTFSESSSLALIKCK